MKLDYETLIERKNESRQGERRSMSIPKRLAHKVKSAWKDCDGYWVILSEGYVSDNGEKGIRENTLKRLWASVADARKGEEQ